MDSIIQYLLDCTICPPRAEYDPDNTISVITTEGGDVYLREKVVFQSNELKLMGSLWRDKNSNNPKSCCIFLHSLGTNQFEVLNIIPFLVTPDLAVFAFDFPGCGMSEGSSTPLDGTGHFFVSSAVSHLKSNYGFTYFALWGRSMGAAIALHSVSLSNDFCCVASDSAFECIDEILLDQAKANKIPSFLMKMAFPVFRRKAKRLMDMEIDCPFPIAYVSAASTPLLMGHGSKDTFVPPHHAEDIFLRYGCKNKQLYIFDAKHNSTRPYQWYQSVARFIYRHAKVDAKPRNYNYVYATSHLHVGSLDIVLEDIDNQRLYQEKISQRQSACATECTSQSQSPAVEPVEPVEPAKHHRRKKHRKHHHDSDDADADGQRDKSASDTTSSEEVPQNA